MCLPLLVVALSHQQMGCAWVVKRILPPILAPVRRGILGGTFDPPHLAHLLGGEAAYRELELDMATFMPAGSPWQKAGRDVTTASHRWEMTVLATDAIGYFDADDVHYGRAEAIQAQRQPSSTPPAKPTPNGSSVNHQHRHRSHQQRG